MRGWQWLGAAAAEEGWQRLCGSEEGCERWLCMAEKGQQRSMGGGYGHVDIWGSCCGRGDGDMVAGGYREERNRGGQWRKRRPRERAAAMCDCCGRRGGEEEGW
ncbi:hypothetical protein B296_00012407 [Ensete ventricosum]|uniref:Uncharacterized protein n=1 Tax=Ensete ventricosum TaxID=4639 RepID=A0A426ZNN2_ENSVE|nr:hypothetical protein B296_00012407 [Ensete ventricosum]